MKYHTELYEKLNVKVAIAADGGTTKFPAGEFDKIFDYINQLQKENEELMGLLKDPISVAWGNPDISYSHYIAASEHGEKVNNYLSQKKDL